MSGQLLPLKSLERGLAILATFSPQRPTLSLREIAEGARIPRSSAYRFLRTLMSHEFIVDLDGVNQRRCAIGPAVLSLARAAFGQAELRRCAYPVMRVIAEKTGETVNLSVRQGSRAICIESIDRLIHHAEIIPIEGGSDRRRAAELTQKTSRPKSTS